MGLAGQDGRADQRGYAMAALLVGLSVMSVVMAAALPVWSHATRREREEELIWRGEQYKRAIMLFQRKYANTFPPTVDILVEQKFLRKKYKDPITGEDFQLIPVGGGAAGQMPGMRPPGAAGPGGGQGGTGAFGAGQSGFGGTTAGAGGQAPPQAGGFGQIGGGTPGTQPSMGIQGVTSKSTETSIRLYNNMNKYNQWAFVYLAASTQAGAGGAQFARPGQGANPPGTGGFGTGGFGAPPPGAGPGGFGAPGGGFGQPGPQGPGGFGQPPGGQPPGGFGQPVVQPKFPPVPGGFGTPPAPQPGGAPSPFKPPPA